MGKIIPGILVFYPFLGGLLCPVIGRKNEKLRDYFADFVAVSECLLMLSVYIFGSGRGGETVFQLRLPGVCGMGLFFTMDGFRLIYGLIAAWMWMMTTILSREYFTNHHHKTRFYSFFLLTLGATMGVFLSAELYTTFIFFEIMSFTSYVWVAQEENEPSLLAAATYLAVAVIGGMAMLMGLFILYHELGTLTISELLEAARAYPDKKVLYGAGLCILTGFGAKAGAFPLHIWLPKAHPVAPAPASALLSGILTKTGIFGILAISSTLFLHDETWGRWILGIGVLTMLGGALLAVFSIDLKRTLACSSMSQIGFIMVGIGMASLLEEERFLAVRGTLLHMINHSLIKLVLFMAAGVIYMNAHALDLNEIRGFGRKKPLLKFIFLVGALTIAGIPFFGGYISKTLLHESMVEYGGGWAMRAIEYLFLFSGGLTVAYMTKLYVAIFVEENNDKKLQRKYDLLKNYMNPESEFALGASAVVLFIWGLFPHLIMDRTAAFGQAFMNLEDGGEVVSYFSLKNLSGGGISILIGAIVYFFVIRRFLMKLDVRKKQTLSVYVNPWPRWLDLETLIYRPALKIAVFLLGILCRFLDSAADLCVLLLRKTVYRDSPLPYELPEGTVVTLWIGKVLNAFQSLKNKTWRRSNPTSRDYVHIMALNREIVRENNTVIQRSLSFGLLLFCIGLSLTLIYILWWH